MQTDASIKSKIIHNPETMVRQIREDMGELQFNKKNEKLSFYVNISKEGLGCGGLNKTTEDVYTTHAAVFVARDTSSPRNRSC